MESNRRTTKVVVPQSPRLQGSGNGTPTVSRTTTAETHPFSSNFPRIPITRTISTSKTRQKAKDYENRIPKLDKEPPDNLETLAGIFHRSRISDAAEAAKPKKTRSAFGSPSAWALSPGRYPATPMPEEKQRSRGFSGVLRFFREKKLSSAKEEASHQLRILQTRLMQWRFVNARAEAALAARKSTAEKKIFNAWSENFQLRNSVAEKKMEVRKLMEEIKLDRILSSQIPLLNDWEKIDKSNLEAVSRSTRLLRSASLRVPLVGGAKADMSSVYTTICKAMDIMEGIEVVISRFFLQVEKVSSLFRELVKIVNQERRNMKELLHITATIAALEARERSLRIHLIQALQRSGFCGPSNTAENASSPQQKLASLSQGSHSLELVYVQ